MSRSNRIAANIGQPELPEIAPPWPLLLYRKSVLKQEKFHAIERFLPSVSGKACLDIGGDNGVISYLLRQRGGLWHSADSPEAVEAIQDIVGNNVHRLSGPNLPFPGEHFDLVVVIDYMEHIREDRQFAQELFRVLKPGGHLIVNVPHYKKRAVLRPIRTALGLTDERHGHVRPGYREDELQSLLHEFFDVTEMSTYSRFFSQAIDTLFGFLHGRVGRGKGKETSKGIIVTQQDFEREGKSFLLASLVYPLCKLLVRLNAVLFFTKGYLLIARACKHPAEAPPRAY